MKAVAHDPAMLIWLDGRYNRAGSPNENFARELFELFTLGRGAGARAGHDGAAHGAQPYTEQDVAEAARACTGWVVRPVLGTSQFLPSRHDGGDKTVLGVTGALDMDGVIDLATRHPSCAPHVTSRLWSRVARPAGPDDPVVVELASAFARDLDVTALLRRMLLHPEFRARQTRKALIKTPIEWLVGAVRATGATFRPQYAEALVALGQVPFLPPDVSGWPTNEAWLSTAAALQRLRLATWIAADADVGAIADASPADRPAVVAVMLGVDRWSKASDAAFASSSDPRTQLTIGLASPEFLLN